MTQEKETSVYNMLTKLPIFKEVMEASEKTKGSIKVISFFTDKGGTGKTANSYQIASFCAEVLNAKVLLIDGDRSKNLTNRFGIQGKHTVNDLFKVDGDFAIYPTGKKNIDIIIGDSKFTDKGTNSSEWSTKYLEFYYWLGDNIDTLEQNYDYIIIDTHNDVSQVTLSLLTPSDVIVSAVKPDPDSYDALYKYKEDVEEVLLAKTKIREGRGKQIRTAYDATKLILANSVKFSGNNMHTTNKEFIAELEKFDNYIGLIPERDIFVESSLENKSIFQLYDELSESNSAKESKGEYVSHIAEIYLMIIYEACKKCLEKNLA